MRNVRSLILALSFVPMVTWGCDQPSSAPELPDGATAVSAQMVKANNDVKAYVKAVQDYLACAHLAPSKEKAILAELKDFAESFNVQVRAYKAKNGG